MSKFHVEKRELKDKVEELQPIVDEHEALMELGKNNLEAAEETIAELREEKERLENVEKELEELQE